MLRLGSLSSWAVQRAVHPLAVRRTFRSLERSSSTLVPGRIGLTIATTFQERLEYLPADYDATTESKRTREFTAPGKLIR